MPKTKMLPVSHSGKLRPHHHTSYGAIVGLLLFATLPTLLVHRIVAADSLSGGGTEGIFAVVPSPLPLPAPTITSLNNGQLFTTPKAVLVSGSCPSGALMKVFKDEVMSGITPCQSGHYSLPIDLFIGGNSLITRAYNANNIPGPDSVPVSVQFLPPGATLPPPGTFDPTQPPKDQLYITSSVSYRSSAPKEDITWPLTIAGGQGPYSLVISWGDGSKETLSQPTAGDLTIHHAYATPAKSDSGTYSVRIAVTDSKGTTSLLELFALIPARTQSTITTVSTTQAPPRISSMVQTTWKVLGIATIATLAGWFIEKRSVMMLHAHGFGH